MEFVLENCKIWFNGKLKEASVTVSNGKIREVSNQNISLNKRINCSGKILLPGAIDSHVHFRMPGQQHKEHWRNGSNAAVAGGITTVLDMPNNRPATTTLELLQEKREIAERYSVVNFGFHFAATENNLKEIKKVENIASVKVFFGSSTGNLLLNNESKLIKVFEVAKEKNLVVSVHAEDEKIIQENLKKFANENSVFFHNKIRSSDAEVSAIEKILEIQEKVGNKLHFCHVTTKEGIELIRKAKKKHQFISCETTPHHLFLTEKNLKELGNLGKVNPPLRNEEDVEALWNALRDGTVDLVATDHAPHTLEEKMTDYNSAPAGMPGVETMLPLLLDAVNEEKISFKRVIELIAEKPAQVFGINGKGKIEKGFDADLIVVDLEKETVVEKTELYSKCKWSCFEGHALKAAVEKTFVNGNLVKDEFLIHNKFLGKEVCFHD